MCDSENVNLNACAIAHIERFALACVRNGGEPKAFWEAHRAELEDKILIADDVSCGVVPIDETLRAWRERGVTGIVVFCDIEALQLVSLLDGAGMSGAFSLVGFDNIERVLGLPTPLCTVDGSLETMAQAAFERLDQRVRGDESPCRTVMLPARVVCRGSCRI